MVHDPLGILDALMIAVSGFFIVFLMLAVLWGIIVIVSRAVGAIAGRAVKRPRLRRLHRHRRLFRPHRPPLSSRVSTRHRPPASWLSSATRPAFRSTSLYLSLSRQFKGENDNEIYGIAQRQAI
ncbi:MAG: hypothetical protein ACLR4Z_04670 [Butyricicoccaceae bacterium]